MIDIEVKNLTKTFLQPDSKNKHKYKYLNVLNNLNLEVKNNEVISLIGPSGSGKSTLLNILSGYDSDYQGIININRNIEGKKLSFIFQSHNLLPWLTAVENVKLVSNSESLDTNRPQKILEELGLKNFINTSCIIFPMYSSCVETSWLPNKYSENSSAYVSVVSEAAVKDYSNSGMFYGHPIIDSFNPFVHSN